MIFQILGSNHRLLVSKAGLQAVVVNISEKLLFDILKEYKYTLDESRHIIKIYNEQIYDIDTTKESINFKYVTILEDSIRYFNILKMCKSQGVIDCNLVGEHSDDIYQLATDKEYHAAWHDCWFCRICYLRSTIFFIMDYFHTKCGGN